MIGEVMIFGVEGNKVLVCSDFPQCKACEGSWKTKEDIAQWLVHINTTHGVREIPQKIKEINRIGKMLSQLEE